MRPSQTSLNSVDSVSISAVRTLQFPGKLWTPNIKLDVSKYHWLAHETIWKRVIEERLTHGCLEASLQIDIDFSRVLTEQISRIKALGNQFFSVDAKTLDHALHQIIQTRQLTVTFPQ